MKKGGGILRLLYNTLILTQMEEEEEAQRHFLRHSGKRHSEIRHSEMRHFVKRHFEKCLHAEEP